jgi:hypothetical protein
MEVCDHQWLQMGLRWADASLDALICSRRVRRLCGLFLERVKGLQHGLLESDAMVGEGMVRGHVNCRDLGTAGFVKSFDEGVVGWGKAII